MCPPAARVSSGAAAVHVVTPRAGRALTPPLVPRAAAPSSRGCRGNAASLRCRTSALAPVKDKHYINKSISNIHHPKELETEHLKIGEFFFC